MQEELLMPRRPRTIIVRKIMHEILRTSSDFDAFCLDYFDTVYRKFTGNMDRITKENLLFQDVKSEAILENLAKHDPVKFSHFQTDLTISDEIENFFDENIMMESSAVIGDGINLYNNKQKECAALRADKYANVIGDLLRSAQGEVCFALFGHWGRGKTFLANQLINKLKSENYACIWFSSWRYRNRTELWIYLYETIREAFGRESIFLRIPMIFRGRWTDEGVSGIVMLMLAIALAFIPIGEKVAFIWKIAKLLGPVFGLLGLFRIGGALSKQWSSISSFIKRYTTTVRHNDKLGLQAALGDDLKVLLWGWLGGHYKSKHMKLGALTAYLLAACAMIASLWLALAPSTNTESGAAQWISDFLKSYHIQIYTDSSARIYIISAVAFLLFAIPLWLICSIPLWQWWKWRKVGPRRALLIVDDLDRLPADELLDIIEQIKLFLEHEGLKERLQVIMICEEEALRAAISKRYKGLIESKDVNLEEGQEDHQWVIHKIIESTLQKLFIASLRLSKLSSEEQHYFLESIISFTWSANQKELQNEKIKERKMQGGDEDAQNNIDLKYTDLSVQRNKDLDLSSDEGAALHEALEILGKDGSAWAPLGPRAIASFVFRYKLARRLLDERGGDLVSPIELAIRLAERLANAGTKLTKNVRLRAVLDEVS